MYYNTQYNKATKKWELINRKTKLKVFEADTFDGVQVKYKLIGQNKELEIGHKRIISWEEFAKDVKLLSKIIKDRFSEGIELYPIPRGGLYVAAGIAYNINGLIVEKDDFVSVVVDDVSDTGNTLAPYKGSNRWTATLYRKDGTITEPDFYVKTINEWIVFPWEKE